VLPGFSQGGPYQETSTPTLSAYFYLFPPATMVGATSLEYQRLYVASAPAI
jgi:hypothetical protein